MDFDLIECPKCSAYLMTDATECHVCGHVLKSDSDREAIEASPALATEVDQYMEKCRACGEPCRRGLIRCWNCKMFLSSEIERIYLEWVEEKKQKK